MSRKKNTEAREHVLQAAYGLFHERGYRGVSMDDVARASGLKKANLFHYFHSKEDLGIAVFDYVSGCLKESLALKFSNAGTDPVAFVGRLFGDTALRMKKNGCCRGCFVGNMAQELSDHNEKIRKKISDYFEFWVIQMTALLKSAQSRGALNKRMRPREAAEALLSLMEGSMLFSKARKEAGAIENAGRMAEAYLASYRP